MAKKLTKRNLIIVAVVVLLLVVGYFAGVYGALLSATGIGPNTNAVSYSFAGVSGRGGYPVGDRHEILPWDRYVASWDPNGAGQDAAWSGEISIDAGPCRSAHVYCTGVSVPTIQVFVQLTMSDGSVTTVQSNNQDTSAWAHCSVSSTIFANSCPLDWRQIQPSIWTIRSPDGKTIIPDGASIHVLIVAPHVLWYWNPNLNDQQRSCASGVVGSGPNGCDVGSGLLADDWARLYSGIGSVHWSGAKSDGAGGIYATVGDSVQACWQVGYVTDAIQGVGWYIHVYSRAQGKEVIAPYTISAMTGCIPYTVASADFVYNGTVQQNGLDLYLWNQVFSKDVSTASVNPVGAAGHVPSCSTDSWSPQSPKQGDTVTLAFHCTAATSAPQDQIKQIEVRWGYGTLDHDSVMAANSTSYAFSATQSGIVNFELRSISNAGILSGTQNYKVSIDHQPINTCFGSAAYCKTGGGGSVAGIPIWVIMLLAGIGAIGAAIFIPRGFVGTRIRIIIILVGVIFFILAFFLYG